MTSSAANQANMMQHPGGGHPQAAHPQQHVFHPNTAPGIVRPNKPINHPMTHPLNQFHPANQNSFQPNHNNNVNRGNNASTFYYYNTVVFPYYSVPVDDDSYSNTDPTNESDNETSAPVDTNANNAPTLPDGAWISGENGSVPDNAIATQGDNNTTLYYCRAQYKGNTYYGQLIANDGCYIQDQTTTIRFEQYEVLTR